MSGGKVERPVDEMELEQKQKGERPLYKRGYTKGSGGGIRMQRVWLYFGRSCICPGTNPQISPD